MRHPVFALKPGHNIYYRKRTLIGRIKLAAKRDTGRSDKEGGRAGPIRLSDKRCINIK